MANESMDAPGLLDAAARLVEKALGQLDTTEKGRCKECSHRWFNSMAQARAHENLLPLPSRLRSIAQKVRDDR